MIFAEISAVTALPQEGELFGMANLLADLGLDDKVETDQIIQQAQMSEREFAAEIGDLGVR